MLPRTYSDFGFRERLVVTTDDPTIGVALTDCALTVDVPDMVQQAQHLSVGTALAVNLGSVGVAYPTAPVPIPLAAAVPTGLKLIVVVFAVTFDGSTPASVTVTDDGGNAWTRDVRTTYHPVGPYSGGAFMALEVHSCDVVTPPSAGITLTPDAQGTGTLLCAAAAAFQGVAAYDAPAVVSHSTPGSSGGAGTYTFSTGTSPGFGQGGELVLGLFGWPGRITDGFSPLAGQLLANVPGPTDVNSFPQGRAHLGALYALSPSPAGMDLSAAVSEGLDRPSFSLLVAYAAVGGSAPGTTAVTFPQPFNTDRPTVVVAIEDGQPGDTATVSAVTALGFSVAAHNSAGASVPRLVSYVAQGY